MENYRIPKNYLTLQPKAKGFAKPDANVKIQDFLFPRCLGNERIQRPSSGETLNQGGSKSPHFRRGHWRKLKDKETSDIRKITWVRPAWINSND